MKYGIFTLESLKEALFQMPPVSPWHACVTKPEHLDRLRHELERGGGDPARGIYSAGTSPAIGASLRNKCRAPDDGFPSYSGVAIYAKVGQIAAGWLFGDEKLLHKYLTDEISEADLVVLAAAPRAARV